MGCMLVEGLVRFDMFALARENNPRGYAHNGFRKPHVQKGEDYVF